MTILKGTDLGASFERLKDAMKQAEEKRVGNGGDGLAAAYSKLYINVEFFVKQFDENPDDLPETLYTKS